MKKIGFLSFGHWTPAPQSKVRTASDALIQSIELAVGARAISAKRVSEFMPRPPAARGA